MEIEDEQQREAQEAVEQREAQEELRLALEDDDE